MDQLMSQAPKWAQGCTHISHLGGHQNLKFDWWVDADFNTTHPKVVLWFLKLTRFWIAKKWTDNCPPLPIYFYPHLYFMCNLYLVFPFKNKRWWHIFYFFPHLDLLARTFCSNLIYIFNVVLYNIDVVLVLFFE